VIILDKVGCEAGQLLELTLIEALEKKASCITEHLRLNNQHIGYICGNNMHESKYLFLQKP
jgi:hypothetical protein